MLKLTKKEFKDALKILYDGTKDYELFEKSIKILKSFAEDLPDEIFIKLDYVDLSKIINKLIFDFDFTKIYYYKANSYNCVITSKDDRFKILIRNLLISDILVKYPGYNFDWLYRLKVNKTKIRFDMYIYNKE